MRSQPGPIDAGRVRLQPDVAADGAREAAILDYLGSHGASFFAPLHDAMGGGFPAQTVEGLWNLVWRGLVTNDTFQALRAFTETRATRRRHGRRRVSPFRSRRLAPPSAEGRWTLVARERTLVATNTTERLATTWVTAAAQQLLARHGIVTREVMTIENTPGGFSTIYPVLKLMEERGRVRRGYFVTGLGAAQFALPGAVDLLRARRDPPEEPEVVVLAATDPANPYGAALPWLGKPSRSPRTATAGSPVQAGAAVAANAAVHGTRRGSRKHRSASSGLPVVNDVPTSAGRGPTRTVGATVILVNGALAAYLTRGDRQLLTFLPAAEPERARTGRAIAHALNDRARAAGEDNSPRGMLIEEIDGVAPALHPLAPFMIEAGFIAGAMGLQPNFRI